MQLYIGSLTYCRSSHFIMTYHTRDLLKQGKKPINYFLGSCNCNNMHASYNTPS